MFRGKVNIDAASVESYIILLDISPCLNSTPQQEQLLMEDLTCSIKETLHTPSGPCGDASI